MTGAIRAIAASALLLGWIGHDLAMLASQIDRRLPTIDEGLQFAALSWIWLSIAARKPVSPRRHTARVALLVVISMLVLPAALAWTSTEMQDSAVGRMLLIGSSALLLWASVSLGGAFTILPSAIRLRTSGPYRFVRHPFYCAYIMGTGGIVLLVPDPLVAVAATVEAVALINRAKVEERLLAREWPAYGDYMMRVRGRVVPLLI